jgi:hypothetical protein
MIQPPFQIVAGGICPQGLSAGQIAPNTCLCVVQNQGTGLWQVTVDDTTVQPGTSLLLLSPGSGSNLPQGVSFGQSQQVGNVFAFQLYRNDTGAAVDFEVHFAVVKFPSGE